MAAVHPAPVRDRQATAELPGADRQPRL